VAKRGPNAVTKIAAHPDALDVRQGARVIEDGAFATWLERSRAAQQV
jgi:hypothetical protein